MSISPSGKIRVLIVDDSASLRMLISSMLSADPAIEVVGTAADGIEAIEKVLFLKPDVVTMDVEMPRMDGITALRQIMAKASATRVIMLSSLTQEGAKTTFEALDAGAFDYVPKTAANGFGADITARVKEAVRSRFLRGAPPSVRPAPSRPIQPAAGTALKGKKISVVGIGASTGGPVALQEVLSRIPAAFPFGIFVAIHMPKAFTGAYAERINSKCAISVREAADGELLRPGTVLIAPGGMHATLVRQAGGLAVKTWPTSDYPHHVYIPSVDVMMTSMAELSGGSMLGVILTGMGNDGFKGMQLLKQKGGATMVQDEATSTIYGMPRACIEGGVADLVLPLGQIGVEIARLGG
ncbi:MAG: chemotaxis response regulator protein-glutamate methylesterase [Desulfuromonadales bacterium]